MYRLEKVANFIYFLTQYNPNDDAIANDGYEKHGAK